MPPGDTERTTSTAVHADSTQQMGAETAAQTEGGNARTPLEGETRAGRTTTTQGTGTKSEDLDATLCNKFDLRKKHATQRRMQGGMQIQQAPGRYGAIHRLIAVEQGQEMGAGQHARI
eukprot:2849359-Rhodomonas_salina.1